MDQDQRAGRQFQRAAHDLARVDGDMVDGAAGLFLIRDQHVLAVEIEDAELLDLAMGHGGVAIIQKRAPTGQDGTVHDARPRQPLGRGLDDLEFLHHGGAGARDLGQPRRRRRQHAVEVAEMVQQAPGEGLHVLA